MVLKDTATGSIKDVSSTKEAKVESKGARA